MRNKPPNEEQMIFFTFLSRYAELKGDSGNTEKNSSSRIDRHQNFGIWTSIRRDRPKKPLKIASEEGHFERFFGSISANTGPNSEILTSVDPSRRVLFSVTRVPGVHPSQARKRLSREPLKDPLFYVNTDFFTKTKFPTSQTTVYDSINRLSSIWDIWCFWLDPNKVILCVIFLALISW